jgi:hypothetical protein
MYYLDETLGNKNHTTSNVWADTTMGQNQAFLPGLYRNKKPQWDRKSFIVFTLEVAMISWSRHC